MSINLWYRYMSPQLKPEEYKAQGGDLSKRLNGDLTKMWGNHPSSAPLKPGEITAIAANLANWLKTGRTSEMIVLDKVLSEENIALDAWIMENKYRRARRGGGW